MTAPGETNLVSPRRTQLSSRYSCPVGVCDRPASLPPEESNLAEDHQFRGGREARGHHSIHAGQNSSYWRLCFLLVCTYCKMILDTAVKRNGMEKYGFLVEDFMFVSKSQVSLHFYRNEVVQYIISRLPPTETRSGTPWAGIVLSLQQPLVRSGPHCWLRQRSPYRIVVS